jgi:hypothetical protein
MTAAIVDTGLLVAFFDLARRPSLTIAGGQSLVSLEA